MTEQNAALGKLFATRRRRQVAAIVAAVAVFVAYSLLPMTPGERRAVGAGPVGLLVLLVVVGFPCLRSATGGVRPVPPSSECDSTQGRAQSAALISQAVRGETMNNPRTDATR